MATPSPYADALCREVAHTPIKPSMSEEMREVEQRLKEDRIELELVVATTQQGKHAPVHNTKATPGKVLSMGLIRNKAGFLFKVESIKAKVDIGKVKKEMAMLEKVAVIAYFVGGHQPATGWANRIG